MKFFKQLAQVFTAKSEIAEMRRSSVVPTDSDTEATKAQEFCRFLVFAAPRTDVKW